jgi:cysteine desulfurase family protein
MIYLDQAATTLQKPEEVEREMLRALRMAGNPGRGAHKGALDANRLVYGTREKLARLFHITNPARIAFTSNATEALNIAIQGMFTPGDHVISTVCEHNSVLRPLYQIEKQGVAVSYLQADTRGVLDYDSLEGMLRPNTKAVIVTHASNLTGNITDLTRIAEQTGKRGILLVVDASQTAGALPIDVEQQGIDVLCFTGHKGLMGPQGTGGIYVREGISIRPLKVGGSGIKSYSREHPKDMPTALEAGTLNTHGIAGLGGALSYILSVGVEEIRRQEMALVQQFLEGVSEIKGVRLYGNPDLNMRTGIASLNLGELDSGTVSDWLWEDYGICVRAGAHCAPEMHRALGTEEQGAVRFSFSHYNTSQEVETAVRALRELI